jgi:hypothetical protein
VLTNAGSGEQLIGPVFSGLFDRLGGLGRAPARPSPAAPVPEPSRVVGRYESGAGTFIVESADDGLCLRSTPGAADVLCDTSPPSGILTPAGAGFDITESGGEIVGQCAFIMDGDRAELLHINGQAVPRAD